LPEATAEPKPPPSAINPDDDAAVGLKYEFWPEDPEELEEAEPPAPTAMLIVEAEEIE
jgi:hypothetical protein